MGCKLTHAIAGGTSSSPHEGSCKKRKKGSQRNGGPLEEPPAPAATDPRLPLTARQKFSIVKSWKGISRALEPTGVTMFLKLFERNAELITLFDKFRELRTPDQQAESLELAEHATVVMTSIDEGIRSIDNIDEFFAVLHQIGGSHVRIPGFKKEYFWKIESPFLEAVKLTLGDRYTENMDQIYKLTIRFVIETVVKGYEMAAEKEVLENVNKLNSISGTYDQQSSATKSGSSAIKSGVDSQHQAPSSGTGCPIMPNVSTSTSGTTGS